jgi:hypothetical protein
MSSFGGSHLESIVVDRNMLRLLSVVMWTATAWSLFVDCVGAEGAKKIAFLQHDLVQLHFDLVTSWHLEVDAQCEIPYDVCVPLLFFSLRDELPLRTRIRSS